MALRQALLHTIALAFLLAISGIAQAVPLYKPFEQTVTNSTNYANKFTDVVLNVSYTSPTNRQFQFYGFYAGDGAGGQNGNVWKMRFMPDEVGTWSYTYSWSDGSPGGSGTFTAESAGAGPGLLKPYSTNPRWFAYNGNQPVFLKSYYIGAGGFTGVPLTWAVNNVYSKLVARGYNHVQMNMLPIGWVGQRPSDAPTDHINRPLWRDTPRVQDLGVWHRMEQHVAWLNDNNIGIHFFMGFDPKPSPTPDQFFALQRWQDMSAADQAFYVRYVASRLAPYANIAGWNYTWETDGGVNETRLMDLLMQYDPWGHLRTYHDEAVRSHSYNDSRYNFAGIENHGYFGNFGGNSATDSASHYQSTIDAYRDKPVYMVEGNGLWRACWAGAAADPSITRAAWAVTLAGGSFTWQDTPDCDFGDPSTAMFTWPTGNPMVDRVNVLYSIMTSDVVFHRMAPRNDLLSNCPSSFNRDGAVPSGPCYALAELGNQYLVYKEDGGSFTLSLAAGTYSATWIDTRTGQRQPANGGTVSGGNVAFSSPNSVTDWVLLVKVLSGGQPQSPYPGPNPAAIPGTIQAENFDNGGQGVGYHDAEPTNFGGAYRTEGVDIQASSGAEAGGHDVGWTRAGEYLNYTVNVASAGSYTAEIRVASAGQGGTFHIEFNGVDKTGPITVPDTGGWQSWQTLSRTVNLSAGQQTMRIVMDSVGVTTGSIANINWVRFTSAAVPPGVTYVSDLPYVQVTNGWGPVEKDMSNGENGERDGQTITLNGVTYSKGLGAHAVSEVRVPLNGNYARFISDIGIDDEMDGTAGTAQFEVWADGVRLYGPSPDMNASSATITVDVDVTGRQELTLKVLEGSVGCCDHADWAGARLTAGGGSVPPTLSGSLATPPSAVNLTTEGGVDWAHWGMSGPGSFNHRTDGGSQISNYALIGSGTVGSYGDNLVAYSWSNGTPTTSATSTTTGMYSDGYGSGFQVTVPADQTTRTVKLYIGAWATTGRLEASLSDNSAPAYVDSSLTGGTNNGGSVGVYTITYRAASAGQQLILKWTVAGQSGGNVQLQAATLTQQ